MIEWSLILSFAITLMAIAAFRWSSAESHAMVMAAIQQNARLLDLLKELYEMDREKTQLLARIVGADTSPSPQDNSTEQSNG